MAGKSTSADYTNPTLREKIKAKVMAGSKGGRPGQWSARKAQLVTQEYGKEGGGYHGGKSKSQKSLKNWGDEHWTTADGKPAKRGKTMARYLPAKAWDALSDKEKKATDAPKRKASRSGRQYVANTAPAARARRAAKKK